MNVASTKSFLKEVSIFGELQDDELTLLAEVATEKVYPKDVSIIRKDEPGTSLLLIRSGEVRVVMEKSTGGEFNLSVLREGDFFGEMSLFNEQPRSATVIAVTDTHIVEISRKDFINQLYKSPEISLKILAVVSERFRRTDEIVKGYSEQIYNHVSVEMDTKLASELDVIKTMYGAMEERALKTDDSAKKVVDSVEQSWQLLARNIKVITMVFTVLGVILGFFGFRELSSIKDKEKEVNQLVEDARKKSDRIEDIGKSAERSEVLLHTMLRIPKVKDDLNLQQNIKELGINQLKRADAYFQGSLNTLVNYMDNYETEGYAHWIVAQASKTFLEIFRQSESHLGEEDSKKVVRANLWILKDSEPNDWESRLVARENLIELIELSNRKDNRTSLKPLTTELTDIVKNADIDDGLSRVELHAYRILVDLNEITEETEDTRAQVVKIIKKSMKAGKGKSQGRNAAIALIKMGKEGECMTGYKYMKDAMMKNSTEGLRSALYLGSILGSSTTSDISCLSSINGGRNHVSKRIEQLLSNHVLKEKINTYLIKLGRPKQPIGLAHFLDLRVRAQNPAILGIPM